MKHADAAALAALCDLIENLRRRSVLVEKRLGIFYIKRPSFSAFSQGSHGAVCRSASGPGLATVPGE
jgi:hypothetical protein